MKNKILIKSTISYIILGIAGFILTTIISSTSLMEYVIKTKADELSREASIISDEYTSSYFSGKISYGHFSDNLSSMDKFISGRIWIVDGSGNVLMDSRKSTAMKLETTQINKLSGDDIHYQVGLYDSYLQEHSLSVSTPIVSSYDAHGSVIIHYPMSLIEKAHTEASIVLYILFLALYLLTLIPYTLYYVFVYRPLQKIKTISMEYVANDFSHKISYNKDDELGSITNSVNYLGLQLNTLEEYQRNFIANISHDFRSPLTSIKGYLEAMMDGTIPHENQEKYFNILLSETERLNKLTQSLLTLNNFESSGRHLEITDFDINSIIKSTATSFEGICIEKQLSIDLILSENSLFVSADIEKIQQVLYNLLDNAIKFSHPETSIIIETTEKNEKVFVSVKDSGIGIPKDCIKKVWDRFYKSDYSRGKDKKGTGLGLTIVKEIIQAHNQNIDVVSTEGVGTKFTFSLAKSKNIFS